MRGPYITRERGAVIARQYDLRARTRVDDDDDDDDMITDR